MKTKNLFLLILTALLLVSVRAALALPVAYDMRPDNVNAQYLQGSAVVAPATTNTLQNIPVPSGSLTTFHSVIWAGAGNGATMAVTANNGTNYLTYVAATYYTNVDYINNAPVATNIVTNSFASYPTGTPVYVTGSPVPTGATAGTVYYVASNSPTMKLYDTQAHAVSGGATGVVAYSSTGTNVVIVPTTLNAAYVVDGAARTMNGITTLIGSAVISSFEDVSAWGVTVTASGNNIVISSIGDAVLTTKFSIITKASGFGVND